MKRATFGTILCDNYTYLLLSKCYIFININFANYFIYHVIILFN